MSLAFVASSSWNTSNKSETLIASNLAFHSQQRILVNPIELRVRFITDFGVTYRNDSIRTLSFRISENELFIESAFVWPLKWKVDPYLSTNFRTTITESFQYTKTNRVRTSNFWDPVISQQSLGGDYTYNGSIGRGSIRIGITLQQRRASDHTKTTDDKRTANVIEAYNAQSGIELTNNVRIAIDSNFIYVGSLDMFGSFDDLAVWTVRSKNEFRFKIWKALALTGRMYITHDVNQTLRTQFASSLMIGIATDI